MSANIATCLMAGDSFMFISVEIIEANAHERIFYVEIYFIAIGNSQLFKSIDDNVSSKETCKSSK